MGTDINRKYRIITVGLDDPIRVRSRAVSEDNQNTGTQTL
jgi:hypothetical protein